MGVGNSLQRYICMYVLHSTKIFDETRANVVSLLIY